MCRGRYRVVHSKRFRRLAMCSGDAGCPQPSHCKRLVFVIWQEEIVVEQAMKCKRARRTGAPVEVAAL